MAGSLELEVDWVEYIAFVLTLSISAAIGVYFWYIKGGQNSVSGYLLGGRELSLIPISVSLITAFVSAVTILGFPSEIYSYGSQYFAGGLSIVISGFISAYVVIPVFHNLQLISAYEYLELRFGRGVRLVMSFLFIMFQLFYIPTCIYAPSIAINQITQVNVIWISILISGVCVFYTTLGGLKAVVWSDTFQGVIMLAAILVILVVGTIRVGGVQFVLSTAIEGGRLEMFDFVPDPTKRLDFWSSFIGSGVMNSANYCFSPESIQRFMALRTRKDAERSGFLLVLGLTVAFFVCSSLGFVMYAEFHDCDPILSGSVSRSDQMLPFFVFKVLGDIKGLNGLFLAGLVAGALSSISAALNTVAATIYRDFLTENFRVKPSDRNATLIIKGLVVFFGCLTTSMVPFLSKLGINFTALFAVFVGLTGGPIIAIFLLGLLFPWVTNTGAICGGLTGLLFVGWLTIARLHYSATGELVYPVKPMGVDGCYGNATVNDIFPRLRPPMSNLPYVYRVTGWWFAPITVVIIIVVGVVVSYLTGFNRLEDVNPDLIAPLARRFLPKKPKDYDPVPLKIITKSSEEDSSVTKSIMQVKTQLEEVHDGTAKEYLQSLEELQQNISEMAGSLELEVDWVEYIAFVLTLSISAAIGVYFWHIKGGQNSVSGYLLGGRELSLIPISVSLITAYVSAITILGVPSEIYSYGTQYIAGGLSIVISGFVSAYFVIPVFHNLQLISAYEYMELRFGRGVRIVMSVLFIMFQLFYIPTCIYAPSVAINQITQVNVIWISILISGVCVFYTTLGGLKAVVWSDTFQGVIMLAAILVILVVGTIRVGGVQFVLSTAIEGGRLEMFDFVPDPTKRLDFWSSFIGSGVMNFANYCFSPESIQRFMALRSRKDAKRSAFLLVLGLTVSFFVCASLGFVMYAEFHDCDPILSGSVSRSDQILPFFVFKVLGDIKGLNGLFLAGLVAGALSSMSAALNTVAATIYRDFLIQNFRVKPSDRNATLIIKGLVVFFGCLGTFMVPFLSKLGINFTALCAVFIGLTGGPIVGIFLLGLLFPWVTNTGGVCGGLTGLLFVGWLTIARLHYSATGELVYPVKPMGVDGCYGNVTVKDIFPRLQPQMSDLPYLYRVTVWWFAPITVVIVIVVGVIVSYLTGFNRLEDVNPDLIAPLARRFLPEQPKEYAPVPLKIITKSSEEDSPVTKS